MEFHHSSVLSKVGSTSNITPLKGCIRCLTTSPMENLALPKNINDYKTSDFELLNYEPHPKIVAPMNV